MDESRYVSSLAEAPEKKNEADLAMSMPSIGDDKDSAPPTPSVTSVNSTSDEGKKAKEHPVATPVMAAAESQSNGVEMTIEGWSVVGTISAIASWMVFAFDV